MEKDKPFYKRVLQNKKNKQLYVIIDKKLNIEAGEYIKCEVQQ